MNMCFDKDLATGGNSPMWMGPEADLFMGKTLSSIRGLLGSLDHMGVRHCNWKSNIRLPECLAGEEDLDLLVHRQDVAAYLAAHNENGFKLAVSRSGTRHPSVIHAFALYQPINHRDAERVKEEEPDRAALERQWEVETEPEYSDCNVVCVNTDQPLNTVLRAIWSNV